MIQIGKMNTLSIKVTDGDGIHLDGGELGDVLLKGKYGGPKLKVDDKIDVFVYADKEQRLLATTHKPYVMVGELAKLRVVATSTAGAFMGWGLEDDLFVPAIEQQNSMKKDNPAVRQLNITARRLAANIASFKAGSRFLK